MRKFLQYALNRVVITALLVLIQIAFFLVVLLQWGNYYVWFSLVLRFITFWAVIYIIWKPTNPAVKLAWVVPILTFPLFGGVLYLCYGHVIVPKKLRDSMERTDKLVRKSLVQDRQILKSLKKEEAAEANLSGYMYSYGATPVWDQTDTKFFADGRPWWESLIDDLEKAEHYIFLEFFIIKEGKMWDAILDILERKAKEGVEVRLMYDDIGCAFLLPKYYDRVIEKKGIKCVAFNRLVPFLSLVLNNRDHRKIVVVDGKVAYTGGINLSDEYINYEHPYGDHWKDTGIRIDRKSVV